MKYFYYISKTKVEMLRAQLANRTFSLSSISSKLGFGFASVTVTAEKQNYTLVADTLKLLNALEKNRSVRPLESLAGLEAGHFYHDHGFWQSGLFRFDSECEHPTITYALWRELGRSLILLVGSPNNILGERIVVGDCFVPGTSGAHLEILQYVDTFLRTDEPVAVRTGPPETYGHDVPVPELSNSSIVAPKALASFEPQGRSHSTRDDDLDFRPNERGLALGLLCLHQLRSLPEGNLDLVFRVFSAHGIPCDDELERLGSWNIEKKRDRAQALGLFNYEKVYLGSPVYTALA